MKMNGLSRAFRMSQKIVVMAVTIVSGCVALSSVAGAVVVTCPSQKLQSAINTAPAGGLTTITFTGTCSENLVVPYGKSVVLVGGASSATIAPKNLSEPVINSKGSTEVRLAIVTSAGTSSNLIEAREGGKIAIVASTLRSNSANALVKLVGNAYGSIVNSELNGGTGASVEVSEGSTVVAEGNSGATLHRNNGKKLIVTTVAPAVLFDCSTSTLHVNVVGSGSAKLSGGGAAIIPSQCRIGIYNGASPSSNIELSNFSGSALGGSMSTYDIQGLTIKDSEYGILADMTSLQIGSAIFSNNKSGDIWVGRASVVNIPGFGGYEKTQFKNAINGVGKFNCYSGARIDINQAAVVQNLSKSSNNCVTVY